MVRKNGTKQWHETIEMREWYEQINGKNDMKTQYGYLKVSVRIAFLLRAYT